MERPWSYTVNVFNNVTKNNIQKMAIISVQHLNGLKNNAGDPFFDARIAFYEPLNTAFMDLFTEWLSSVYLHKGATQTLDELLDILSSEKADAWDTAVKTVYPKGSTSYTSVMGKYHSRFQTGRKDMKVDAVKAFGEGLAGIVPLAALKLEVDGFYTLLKDARTDQQGKIANTKDYSDDLETARINCADGMYANLGFLMGHFYQDRGMIDNYFDLINIRNHHQTVYTLTVPPHSSKTILKHKFKVGEKIVIDNHSTSEDLKFCLAFESGESCTTGVIAHKGEVTTINVDGSFGNLDEDKFLTVTNDFDGEGSLILTVDF